MILQDLPDIPRWYTGLAEWSAIVVYISLVRPRWHGPTRHLITFGSLPILIGVQLLAGALPLMFWTLGMALAVTTIFTVMYTATDSTATTAGYLTARAFVLAELVASLQWQIWVHFLPQHPSPALGTTAFTASVVWLLAAYAAGFGAARYAERRTFARDRALRIDTPSLITASAIAIGTFLVSNLSFLTTSTPFSGRTSTDIFYIRTLVDLAGYVALYTQQAYRNQVSNSVALAQTEALLKAQQEQYYQSQRNIEELNRIHHDLKHYVAAIREEDSAALRSTYLAELEDSIRGYESQIDTGNPTLDVILNSKMERCLRENISMTNVVDGQAVAFMDLVRLSALFGNALDNAIEASLRIDNPDERHIKVSVYRRLDFVMIKVENHTRTAVTLERGLPRTTKRDRTRHGYGLANMRSIVESYEGTMTIDVEDGWFTVRMLVPRPPVV